MHNEKIECLKADFKNKNYNWMNFLNAEWYIVISHKNITTYENSVKHVNKDNLIYYFKIEIYLHSSIPQTIRIMFNDMEIDNPMTKSVELSISWLVNKCFALSAKSSVTLYQTNCQFKII